MQGYCLDVFADSPLSVLVAMGRCKNPIVEGLTYELRLNLDCLRVGEINIDVLRAIGGGAKSKLWLQLKADITGIPVVTPEITEAAGFGAALLAGAGVGVFSSATQAAELRRSIYQTQPGSRLLAANTRFIARSIRLFQ